MNNVQLEGNLARNIEISFSKNGMAVARGTDSRTWEHLLMKNCRSNSQ